MDMMALGEIGADIMSVLLAVAAWFLLDDQSIFVQVPSAVILYHLVSWVAHGFVHLVLLKR
jgi:hypothetical protein